MVSILLKSLYKKGVISDAAAFSISFPFFNVIIALPISSYVIL